MRELADSVLVGTIVGCDSGDPDAFFVLFFFKSPVLHQKVFSLRLVTFSGKINPFLSCQLAESSLGLGLQGYHHEESFGSRIGEGS